MRFVLAAFLASVAPSALLAAPEALSRVVAVTLFPQGAQVTRVVDVPGAGETLIPDLPDQTDAASLRVSSEGMTIGAVTLIDGRVPPSGAGDTAGIAAARDKVQALQAALDTKKDAVAALRAEVSAAHAEAAFLKGVSTENTPAAALPDLVKTVSQGVLEAEKRAITAAARVRQADAALAPDRKALEQARAALDALQHPATSHDTLSVETSGPGKLTIVTFVSDAGWTPAYDLRLDGAAEQLGIERFATVHQASGEDWPDVALTLSTARPSERTGASELMPDLVRAGAERPAPVPMRKSTVDSFILAPASVADAAEPGFEGETLVYRYPTAVSLRDGVEALRLKLDALSEHVTQVAQAVPLLDAVAYRQIEGRNDGEEPLLPGPANLFADGAMVGTAMVPMIAAGDTFAFGFGAIDGLKLSRIVPQASEGDRGLLSKSNARVEIARITVENLTPRDWPVRLLDRVPYSEQDDLKVTWKADPAPSETDWQDRRGVLSWAFDLPKGQKKEITLTTTLGWPAGQVLQ